MPVSDYPPKVLYRVSEAAELLSIGRTRLYEAIKTGDLETVTFGTSRLVPAESIQAFAGRLKKGSTPERNSEAEQVTSMELESPDLIAANAPGTGSLHPAPEGQRAPG